MSIVATQQVHEQSEPLRWHENLGAASAAAAAPTSRVRRFPEAFRNSSPARARLSTIPEAPTGVPVGPRPPADPQEGPGSSGRRQEIETGTRRQAANAAAQAVADKLFPPVPELCCPAESVAAMVHAAAPAVLEVLAGARPARQLARALSPECMLKLECHMSLGSAQRPDPDIRCYSNPRLLRMRITQVLPLVFEATAVLRDMQKVRATALRIERWHGRWQVTALEIG